MLLGAQSDFFDETTFGKNVAEKTPLLNADGSPNLPHVRAILEDKAAAEKAFRAHLVHCLKTEQTDFVCENLKSLALAGMLLQKETFVRGLHESCRGDRLLWEGEGLLLWDGEG